MKNYSISSKMLTDLLGHVGITIRPNGKLFYVLLYVCRWDVSSQPEHGFGLLRHFYFIYAYSIIPHDTKALLHMATMHQVNNHVHHDSWRKREKVPKEETMLEDSEAMGFISHLLILKKYWNLFSSVRDQNNATVLLCPI